MASKYTKHLHDWQHTPSQETYASLCDDINNFNGSKGYDEVLSVLEIMSQILSTEIYFPCIDENLYQLCLDKFEQKIDFPSKDSPYYKNIIDYTIKLLSILKLRKYEIDDEQLFDVLLSVVEFFRRENDDTSASQLFYAFVDEFEEGNLMSHNEIIELFVDIALQTCNTELGIAASWRTDYYDEWDGLYYKTAPFLHIGEIMHFSETITDFDKFFKLYDLLKNSSYSYLLFDALSSVDSHDLCDYESRLDFLPWLHNEFQEFKKDQDESRICNLIVFVLINIKFDTKKELDQQFSFEILQAIIEYHELIFFNCLKETDQYQYVTTDKLYYLKELIESNDFWANEVAKILLKKSSYKKFLKTPSSYFLETIKKTSNPTLKISDSDASKTETINPKHTKPKKVSRKSHTSLTGKTTSAKKPYRPKGLKGQFYGLYKLIHGKKK